MPSAGHVDAGESSIQGAVRETEEELGIKTREEDYIFVGEYIADITWEIGQIYLLKLDIDIKDIKLQVEEVEDVKWLTLDEFKSFINTSEFVPYDDEYKEIVMKLMSENLL